MSMDHPQEEQLPVTTPIATPIAAPITLDPRVRKIADLLARRHSPGNHWQRLEDIRPLELTLLVVEDATAIVELLDEELVVMLAGLHELHREHLDARGRPKCTKCRAADGSPLNYPCPTVKLLPPKPVFAPQSFR